VEIVSGKESVSGKHERKLVNTRPVRDADVFSDYWQRRAGQLRFGFVAVLVGLIVYIITSSSVASAILLGSAPAAWGDYYPLRLRQL
jgi:hypothetical protein